MTLKIFFCFFLLIFSVTEGIAQSSVQKPWNKNRESIEKSLAHNKILKLTPMRDFLRLQGKLPDYTNEVFLAELEGDIKAVFKYDPEERDMYGEVAAYRASQHTGADCVPPTVIRKHGKKNGSLQLYIETTIDGSSSPEAFEKYYERVPATERADAEAFAFVFGQWDKSYGNFLFITSPDSKTLGLILIDNAGISQLQYVRIGQSPFVRRMYSDKRKDKWTTEFPFSKMCEIPYESIKNHKDLKDFNLGPAPFQFLKAENRPLRYVLWNNSLWFQAHNNRPFIPQQISRRLLDKLVSLSEKDIKTIWKQTPRSCPTAQKRDIIKLTLERRDQLLSYIKLNNIPVI